jgi:hypothetical protein
MKEFSSQTGGRFTYVDDVINLQELALAFGAIFEDCDNFIVSGCEVSGNAISSGIVYLNGKLRVFNGASGMTSWPQYIYEVNETENTPYQSGGEKVGRNVWSCAIGSVVPTTLTPLTNKIPQSIQITANGGLRMKDAWIGKYALLLDAATPNQKVKGTLSADTLSAPQVTATSQMRVATAAGTAYVYYEGSNMVLESSVNNGATKYRLVATNSTGGFQLIKNSTVIATFTDSQISFAKPVIGNQATFGSVRTVGTQMFNSSTATDEGELSINVFGLNGANTYYRNTHIGNGKGTKLLSIIGRTADIFLYGAMTLNAAAEHGITLISNKPKTDLTLKKLIAWQDSNKVIMAQFGFTDLASQIFVLSNSVGSIKIQGLEFVDIVPVIKENGVLLSDKYVLKTDYESAMDEKVDKTSVYTQAQANQKFATLTGGLAQFINNSKTKAVLCDEIGALTPNDLEGLPTLKNCLSDMATTEALKKQIRDNIGAAGAGDFQAKLNDTGWVKISGNLYARQIGNIVSVQGTLSTIHSGTVFTLPNNIDAPRYAVGYDAAMKDGCYWSCQIEGGQKACTVTRCNHHGMTVPISIIYMI